MRALVLGATGTVGSRVADHLAERGTDVRRASRRGSAGGVTFDWSDPSTFRPALEGVQAVHLLPPPGDTDPEPTVLPFLELARLGGIRRATLLSASSIPWGGAGLGRVAEILRDFVPEAVVLRPTWFASNLTDDHAHAQSIAEADEIVTATGNGRIPFIDPDDIAAVAATVLTALEPPPADLVLTGPEALTFAEAAEEMARHTGRIITHRHVDEADVAARWVRAGLPDDFARMLATMDTDIAGGAEDRVTSHVHDTLGRRPRSLREFLATR